MKVIKLKPIKRQYKNNGQHAEQLADYTLTGQIRKADHVANEHERKKGRIRMKKEIWLDMDGTIADLYGVENWLEYIKAEDEKPYKIAKPLVNMKNLAEELNRLQKQGWTIGIITWLAKNGKPEYNDKVARAKLNWLEEHLNGFQFDRIYIVEYGTPKEELGRGILIDDEIQNRINWKDKAYDEKNILETLGAIA